MNVLFIHGNGGSPARFEALSAHIGRLRPRWRIVVAELSGFGGKELPKAEHYWNVWLADLFRAVEGRTQEPWCIFAQGAGCALVLELSARGWEFPNGYFLRPRKTILYGGAGVAGERNWLYGVFHWPPAARMLQRVLSMGFLRKMWAKRFLSEKTAQEDAIVGRFFLDVKECQAFTLPFELISRTWYAETRAAAWHQRFLMVWGGQDRLSRSQSAARWKKDFPKSEFQVVEQWGHFPMLDDPEGLAAFLVEQIG